VPYLSFFEIIALALAMSRDGSSGGVIRMAIITEKGVERIFVPGDKLPGMFSFARK
jgi:20S proteasome subunit beta 1